MAPSQIRFAPVMKPAQGLGEEDRRICHLLGLSHAAHGIAAQCLLIQVGHTLLGHVPEAVLEIDGPGRKHIGAYVF